MKEQLMKDKTNCKTFTEGNFRDEVLKSKIPVLVVCEADWSGTCDILIPIMENLCVEFKDRLKIGMMDIDRCGSLAEDYRIYTIPALVFFVDGEIVDQLKGLVSRQEIAEKINNIVSSGIK